MGGMPVALHRHGETPSARLGLPASPQGYRYGSTTSSHRFTTKSVPGSIRDESLASTACSFPPSSLPSTPTEYSKYARPSRSVLGSTRTYPKLFPDHGSSGSFPTNSGTSSPNPAG